MQNPLSGRRKSKLCADDIIALVGYGVRTTWPANFQIYQRGAAADGVSLVLRSHVILRNKIRAGRGFVPAVVTPGETFGVEGLVHGETYVTDASAADDTETLFLSGSRFRAFVREMPQQALHLVGQLMSERSSLLEKLHELASQNVEERLIAALQGLAGDRAFLGTDGSARIEVKHHRLLCEMVGATRESIALALGRLVGSGLAERRGTAFVVAPHRLAAHITRRDALGGEGALPLAKEPVGSSP